MSRFISTAYSIGSSRASGSMKPLTIIFNATLNQGKLPKAWKEANITAIYKKGSKNSPCNYRPVNLTSIVESLIRDRMMKHMQDNNFFSQRQFGFLPGRSTVTQLLIVFDKWTDILDQGGSIDAVYCDYMKAFDKVSHDKLLNKVNSYGINTSIQEWTRDFLNG